MPLCLGASGSVRTYSWHQSARWPSDVQIFWPLTTKSSPSRTARVRSDARSEPGLRLRHALTPDVVGAHHPGEQCPLLRVGAVLHDRRGDVVHPDHVERHRSSRPRRLLGVDQLLEHRRAAAAVFLRPGHRTPARVGHRRIPRRAVCRMHRGRARGRRSAAFTSSVRLADSHVRSSLRNCSTSAGYEKSTVSCSRSGRLASL